jgi:uncharacterized membrane protein YgcG
MSTKGFNKFEQHVEKAVVGVAVLALAAVVAMRFLSAPTVKVGPKEVAPGDVDAALEAKARGLSSQLSEAGIQFESGAVDPASPAFRARLAADSSPVDALVPTSPNFNKRLLADSGAAIDQWYYVPTLPPLRMKGVNEHADALTPASAAKAKAVSPVLAARPDFATTDSPKDVVWTTPFAVIDLKALRAELRRGNAEAKPPLSPIPSIWYEERANPPIVDVVFERRRQDASGAWGPAEVVPAFAERAQELMLRDEVANPPLGFRAEAFAVLGDDANQLEILQAPFYETVNGAFVSPSVDEAGEDGKSPAEDDRAAAAERQRRKQKRTTLERRKQRAESLRAEIERLGGMWDEEVEKEREEQRKRDERDQRGSGSGGGGGGGGGMGSPGGGLGGSGAMNGKNSGSSKDADRERQEQDRKRKEKSRELRSIEAQIAELEKELGIDAPAQGAAPQARPALSSLDELLVWGHDLEVDFGATYQYRCVVRMLSPFYGKGNQLVKEQDDQGLSARCTLDSVASEWGQPVTVSPRVQFFVTRASVGDVAAAATAVQCEVYKFDGGKGCRDEMALQVGDQIGRREQVDGKEIDFSTSFVVLDVVEDKNADRAAGSAGARRPAVVVVAPIGGGDPQVRIPRDEVDSPARARLGDKASVSEAPAAPAAGSAGGNQPAAPPTGPRS